MPSNSANEDPTSARETLPVPASTSMADADGPCRGRLKKFYWKQRDSFGYIESLDSDDDIYFYAAQLVKEIGLEGSFDKMFAELQEYVDAGRFVEVCKVRNERGEKAVPPMSLLPAFQGEDELAELLDARREAKKATFTHSASRVNAGDDEDEEESEDEDPDNWPSPDGSYLRMLQEEVSHFLDMKKRACARKPSNELCSENVKDYVEWLTWQNWDLCYAWKGLSAGTLPEKAAQYFGGNAKAIFPGKVKTFLQDVSGVVVWNNNGSPYTYPKQAWKFLHKYCSYDIERVAQDMERNINTQEFICHWCAQPRIVGKDYYEDESWYCKSCFLSWKGIGPRGMSDKGRLNKSRRGKAKAKPGKGKKK